MKKRKYVCAILSFLFLLPGAYAGCHIFPPGCTLDTEGKAPGNNCASKSPFLMSYQLSKDERTYKFRMDCGGTWGQNAWNIGVYTTSTWKTDGTVKQVAEWQRGEDHGWMQSVVKGTCKTDPWIDANASCTKQEYYYVVSSSLLGKNGLPDALYDMYKEILGQNVKDPFPNTTSLISADKKKEISMRAMMLNVRERFPYKLPPPK